MTKENTDAISLDGFKRYASGLKLFYTAVFRFIMKSFKTYWYILLLGLACGGVAAYVKHKRSVPYYEGQASFTYTELHKRIYGEMIDKLSMLVKSSSYKTLSEQLKISEQDTRTILDIEAVNVAGSPLSEDMTKDKTPFYIRLKVTNRNLADTLLVCIENYFNHNRQAQAIISNNLRQMGEKIIFYKLQLQKLDSLKRFYQFYLAEQNIRTNPTINSFNPISLFTESERLFNATSDLESAIKSYKAVKILDGFVISDYPVSPSLTTLLLKYAGIGLVLAALVSLVLYFIKNL